MPRESINGTNLYYEVHGTSSENLLFIHSGLVDSRVWREQIAPLSKAYRVIVYDIRGFGRSDLPTAAFRNVDDVKLLMDHLEIPRAHLVGCSMGGAIALDFAATYPELVQSLTLSGPSLNGYTATRTDETSEIRNLNTHSYILRDERFEEAVDGLLNDPIWRQSSPEKQEFLRTLSLAQDMRWLFQPYWIPHSPSTAERLSEISQPVLLLLGDREPGTVYEVADILMEKLPQVTRVDIPNAGHLPCLEQPEAFNQALFTFLEPLSHAMK
ncbi:alpha/beta fold hydrolase [Tumebacillus lipolyticus]|uniref:Alpha/beta fold hydrolase n=1 Tax=Tumebacillus lipolyticus TaxID=1280370 RepID=A0ABW4ZV82_9BACL